MTTLLPVEDLAADEIAMKDAAAEDRTDSPVDRFVVVPWIVTTPTGEPAALRCRRRWFVPA